MDIVDDVIRIFGAFRAENLGKEIYTYYTQPHYFHKLTTKIPCILQGGRGTGKTTVLKSLSYEGQYTLHKENPIEFKKIEFVGIYFKLETGLVSSFLNGGQEIEFWKDQFINYLNTQINKQIIEFLIWYKKTINENLNFNSSFYDVASSVIGPEKYNTIEEIELDFEKKIIEIENNINFSADIESYNKIILGNSIKKIIKEIKKNSEFSNKTFYILFDEYENLQEYQQKIINTLIKQADIHLSIKIGIRELGLKTKNTLNETEQLVDPADYVLIDTTNGVKDKEFEDFAIKVIETRFKELQKNHPTTPINPNDLFEEITEDQEVELLGGQEYINNIRSWLKKSIKTTKNLQKLTNKDLLLIYYLSNKDNDNIKQLLNEALENKETWANKLNNYSHAALYSIRRKKVGITKYYCGWKTLVRLSSKNIRYFLQLIVNCAIEHIKENKDFSTKITPKTQTNVAIEIGKKNLMELEGISNQGGDIMRLVLGLGQIFHELAINSENHTPEITQFELTKTNSTKDLEVFSLLNNAVMHLALLRFQGTKLSSSSDIRDFDYMLHPIFSPFFVYSYRRKRKFSLNIEEIDGIINSPNKTISKILGKQNRSSKIDLPDQLALFGSFYETNT